MRLDLPSLLSPGPSQPPSHLRRCPVGALECPQPSGNACLRILVLQHITQLLWPLRIAQPALHSAPQRSQSGTVVGRRRCRAAAHLHSGGPQAEAVVLIK